jgi:hypothetical protein
MKKTIIFGALIIILLGAIFAAFYFGQNENSRTVPQGETITINDLRAEMENLEKINAYPDNRNIDPKDYPIVLGPFSENGLILIERYFCSDVCPDYGGVSIVFQNITSREECAKVGGKDLIDAAWGGYVGCAPKID